MSIVTMILGESGTGKSASIRSLSPDEALIIQSISKPLPFKSAHKPYAQGAGNIFVTDNHEHIVALAQKTKRKIIVLDDFQYVMANEFMRSDVKGYEKFTDIGRHAWIILSELAKLPADVRVYVISHTESTDDGRIKIKTVGRMLDEKICLEGMVTIVLRTAVDGGSYYLTTQNNGQDTVKSPMGLFNSIRIDNDLKAIDTAICEYYEITEEAK